MSRKLQYFMLWGDYLRSRRHGRENMALRIYLALILFAAVAPHSADAHGGGCRKSSPPGQCCHMDNSTGTVHCH